MRHHQTPAHKWWSLALRLAILAPTLALGAETAVETDETAGTAGLAVAPETPLAAEASTGPTSGVPTFAQSASPTLAATFAQSETEGIPRVVLLSCDSDGASFEVTFPEAETYTVPVGNETFTGIHVPGTGVEDLPGSVGLPVFRARLFIPPGATTIVSTQTFEPYSLSVDNPLPAPRWVESGEVQPTGDMVSMVPVYELDPALAAVVRPTVEPGAVETVRGWRLAHFLLRPVEYADGRMTGYRRIRIVVAFRYPTGRPRPNMDTGDSPWALDLARSLAPDFEYARDHGWRLAPPPPRVDQLHSGQLPLPRLKVVVEHDGLYRVTPQDLVAAGLDPATVDPRRLTLYASSGKMLDFSDTLDSDPLYPVPVLVTGEADGTFDEGDALYFWGHGSITWLPEDDWDPDLPSYSNLYSPYGYYWLAQTDEPLRFLETDAAPSGEPSLAWLQGRLHREEDKQSMARAVNVHRGMDYSFWFTVDTNGDTVKDYQIGDHEPGGGDARLSLRFQAGELDVPATLRVFAGQTPGDPSESVLTVVVDTPGKLYEVWGEIPAPEMEDGANHLTFELSVPSSPDPDDPYYAAVFVDSFQVIYDRGLRLGTSPLEGWGPPGVSGNRRMQVSDVTGDELVVWDLTRGESLVNFELTGPEGSRDAEFCWNAEPGYHLVVTDLELADPPLDVYLDAPSDLHSPVDADLVYIAHPDLVAALDPLVEMHRAEGLRARVIRVDDIYDEYSGGRLDPAAIRNYLYHAWTDCVGDPLTFVTLVGDTSFDYRDVENRYLGPNWRKFPQAMLPTAYVISHSSDRQYFVACDNYFASLLPEEQPDDDVPIPQVALTRISAYEPSQLESYVALATTYPEIPSGAWQTNHVLLVDNTVDYQDEPPDGSMDETITFDIYAELMLRDSAQAGMAHDKVYMTSLGMAQTRDNHYTPPKYDVGKRRWATREHVTPAFWEALESGELIVSFIGHGAWHTWTHELAQTNRPPLYRDFDEWDCPFPPLLIQSSCSVGDFDRTPSMDPNCISELLLWHPRGCIATVGSSRTSGGGAQDYYHRALFEAFYHPVQHLEIPAFGLAHMQDLIIADNSYNRQRQTMFGDSASLLRRAAPGLAIDPPSGDRVARGEVLVVTGGQTSWSPESPVLTGTVQIRAYDRPLMPYEYTSLYGDVPPTRMYRLVGAASTELVDGSFTTQIALPLGMDDDLSDYEIYPYNLELRAWMVDEATGEAITAAPFSGNEVWSLPIVGSVDPPADNEGPVVVLLFDDGATASGDYIDGSVKLTAELEDPQGLLLLRSDGGVPMASGDIDRPIVLVAEADKHSFDIDLTDYYTPVSGDYTRGVVERQLELPAGEYTLTLYCYDNFGEPGSASAELVVADGLGLSEVLVVPNPAPGPTAFTFFASTRPDQARVRIYTPVGRLVRTIEATALVTGFNVIEWDGNDSGGRPLANGVYLYSLEARDGDDKTTAFEKFIMLR